MKPEDITPYDHTRGKTEQVREMFDNIAPAYDRLNRAMSMGQDRRWRRKAVAAVTAANPAKIIDIATGTGDFAISLAHAIPTAQVTGLDLSEGMIMRGRSKVKKAGLDKRVTLVCGDCLNAPEEIRGADVVTVAFGVRNFADLAAGYRAMHDMLKPGGTLCVIELSTPSSPLIKPFYNLYTRMIIPAMGRMVSKDRRAYSYLPESIAAVPRGKHMLALMEQAGFIDTQFTTYTFGVCSVYMGRRPATQSNTSAL